MPLRIPRLLCMGILALALSGCQTLGLGLLGDDATPAHNVREIVCLWEPAEGIGLDGLPTRGFAGQLLFFEPGNDTPVLVDGDVMIYVFDDQGAPEEQSRPLHQFEFPGPIWQTFARDTNLGPAYQIFIPYTRKGGHYADCAIRVRLTGPEQLPVWSKLTNVPLPGRKSGSKPASAAMDVTDDGRAEVELPAAERRLPGTQSFPVPVNQSVQLNKLRQAAQTAQRAQAEVEVPDEAEEPAVGRRYRMSNAIQQTSGTIE